MNYNLSYKKYIKKAQYQEFYDYHKYIDKEFYKYFIIIPVYNEFPTILKTLDSINNQDKNLLKLTLAVLVINNNVSSSLSIINNNFKSYQTIQKNRYKFECIALDYFSHGKSISDQQFGVGIARKIGMDFALKYSKKNSLFFSLDADTIVSNLYLSTIINYFNKIKPKVCTIGFQHQQSKDPIINKGIRIYEKELYHMAQQIKNSKSPYGYISMGSAIVCTIESYIAVGGMSTRNAAEDFYFMQSLAKHTKIDTIKDILIYPSSRNEQRVHLGTGFRMSEYKKKQNFKNLFFSKSSYKIIKDLIKLVDKNYNQPYTNFNKDLNKDFNYNVCNFLRHHKLNNIWGKINNNAKSKKQFMTFFHQWFDALKIMQLLKTIN
tara:strand:- start:740 stop:1870 length:1131 start_codon:yes stop_codon:yes gene_type:complete